MSQTLDQIIAKANQHGLRVVEDSLERNDSGLDFQVVFAVDTEGEHWVLRIPRREDVIPTARKEKSILDLVASRIPVQAPKWVIFSDELIAYKKLRGAPAGTIDPEAKAYSWEIDEKNVPDAFLETLGGALAALHRVHHAEARKAGLVVKEPDELRTSMLEKMDRVKAEFGVSPQLWDRWQKWLANDSLWPKRTAFIHGDLHPGHILVDQRSRVTGLIDWTEARVDDPAHDFVAHLSAFGEDALEKLLNDYQQAGGDVWPAMAEHIIELASAYPIAIAEFALKSGLEEYVNYAKHMLNESK